MKIRALLIDLDGTLIDTHPALFQVYQKFLSHYGHKGTREEFESLIGPSIDEIVTLLKKQYGLKPTVQDLSSMYVSMLMLQGFEGTELFPGVKQVLDWAHEEKIKLAIVTSGTHALVKVCLTPLKVLDKFDLIVTSEDVKKAKPNPEIYEYALKKLKVKADEAVAIEDSSAGTEAATKAGLKVIFFNHEKKLSAKASEKVHNVFNWEEIRAWLKSK